MEDYEHFDEDGDEDPLMEGDFGAAFVEGDEEAKEEIEIREEVEVGNRG